MKTKQEIYENTREMVNKQDKQNYLAYYKVFLENISRNDIPQEEKEIIIKTAYETYKKQEAELCDILDYARLDLLESSNREII
ncbi:hypothetical protein [Intestinibacter bartlettii]|uniref:Uncharacterized protein n=1 Tax=Intestinibacter bartlettii TaxID=261299 RepID=A0ABS6E082_9FIRM|nr:hypothetical protein [Intestinibacter bartlettii]MBU5337506.1 hypothetical protein [Intestinibacter bartlettii]